MYHKSKSSSTNVSKPPPLTSHLLLRGAACASRAPGPRRTGKKRYSSSFEDLKSMRSRSQSAAWSPRFTNDARPRHRRRRTPSTPAPDYWSGYWHHDRCGRRLKAFLFLHDILPDGRPTMVANASHRTHYFTYDWLKGSRFADKYIRANYDVVPMTGKRGGGFIFDTNAIHKGESPVHKSIVATRLIDATPARSRAPGVPHRSIRSTRSRFRHGRA